MYNIRVVPTIATLNDRQIQQKIHAALTDTLFHVASIQVCKGTITVTLNGNPTKASDRSLLISAAQAIVGDTIDELNIPFSRDAVKVVLLPGTDAQTLRNRARILPYKTLYEGYSASAYIQNQMEGVSDYVYKATHGLVHASLHKAIEALPWRDEKAMAANVEPLVQRAMAAFSSGRQDPLLCGCVDEILPPPDAFLSPMDYTFLVQEVARYLGSPPRSRLHFYETIYEIVTHVAIPLEVTCVLFDAVFDNMWDDYMLDEIDLMEHPPASPDTSDDKVLLMSPALA